MLTNAVSFNDLKTIITQKLINSDKYI